MHEAKYGKSAHSMAHSMKLTKSFRWLVTSLYLGIDISQVYRRLIFTYTPDTHQSVHSGYLVLSCIARVQGFCKLSVDTDVDRRPVHGMCWGGQKFWWRPVIGRVLQGVRLHRDCDQGGSCEPGDMPDSYYCQTTPV
jgi:hypothetical protein